MLLPVTKGAASPARRHSGDAPLPWDSTRGLGSVASDSAIVLQGRGSLIEIHTEVVKWPADGTATFRRGASNDNLAMLPATQLHSP